MKGLWLLSWRWVTRRPTQSTILTLCIALSVALPVTVHLLIRTYRHDLTARADATPLLAGAKGNRFDLTLGALYFRKAAVDPIPFAECTAIDATGLARAVPIHVRYTARGHPVVGTAPEYYGLRQLRAARGTLPLMLGDCALGHAVAMALDLGPGDHLFSDPTELYDIARPPALKMHVAGVLASTGGPDDDAVFVDVRTAWILDGLVHGHDEAERLEGTDVLARTEAQDGPGRTGGVVAASPSLVEYHEVTRDNVESFHLHADPTELPLTAVIAVPTDSKSATLLKSRTNASQTLQMVVPREVIADLMDFVFRIRTLFDAFAIVLATTTTLLLGLQVLLSMKLRANEMATLRKIGCRPGMIARLYATELGILFTLALALATLIVAAALTSLPNLVTSL